MIPVSKPDIGKQEIKLVRRAIETGWIANGGYVTAFEGEFAEKHGATYGMAVNSGTNALFLALWCWGVREGDEVLVPSNTMIACAWAVEYTGAKPVFYKDMDDAEKKINKKTKAIMVVHLFGRVENMMDWNEIARDYGLKILEDSSQAHGTRLMGDAAAFSLYANKIVTTGEGGIVVTNDDYLYEQVQYVKNMSFNRSRDFIHRQQGFNMRMSNIHAAIGLGQIRRLDDILKKRKQIETWYKRYLSDSILETDQRPRSVLWMYDVLLPTDAEETSALLYDEGIETRRLFWPLHLQPQYRSEVSSDYSYQYVHGLYLPTFGGITEKQVRFISETLNFYVKNSKGNNNGPVRASKG